VTGTTGMERKENRGTGRERRRRLAEARSICLTFFFDVVGDVWVVGEREASLADHGQRSGNRLCVYIPGPQNRCIQ
jgi:hypothetical protein